MSLRGIASGDGLNNDAKPLSQQRKGYLPPNYQTSQQVGSDRLSRTTDPVATYPRPEKIRFIPSLLVDESQETIKKSLHFNLL